MSNAIVRPAIVEDAEGIAYVHVTAWQETYRGLMPDDVLDTLSVERRAEQWKNTLEDPNNVYHLVVVAEVDGKIIGFANYGRERENDPEHEGELYAIYILKEFQQQGVGRALMKHSASGLRAMNISSLLVWVLSDNPYRKFYGRLGGAYVREKSIQIGDQTLREKAYGWRDTRLLMEMNS